MGAIAGVVMAFYYKELGPQKTTYLWETEVDEANEEEMMPVEIIEITQEEEPLRNESNEVNSIVNPTYNYTFKPKEETSV
jgi:hypothetical protein